jgi:tyrosyl-tRNA synthetase
LFADQEFTLVNNYDWLKDVKLVDFMRDTGKYFSMSQLVDREFFKARVGEGKSGMSYAEFSYTLLQGYDFWHLHKNHGVNLEIGGSDQWGNILSGVDLVRKKDDAEVNGMTAPLVINQETGRKFGKSEAGSSVWLDPNLTSPYEFYQFWLNVDDICAINYLKMFTLLDKPEVDKLDQAQKSDPGARQAQKTLAYEVTKIVHGADKADNVVKITTVLFGKTTVSELSATELDLLSQEIPTAKVGNTITEILLTSAVAKSGGEAKRLLESGAISLNGTKMFENPKITTPSLIKKGKNTFVLVK